MKDKDKKTGPREPRSDQLSVYVAGEIGERPLLVTYSLETAMIRLLDSHSIGGSRGRARQDEGYPEQWTCGFIDGETGDLVWEFTLVDGDETHALYIVKYDVDRDEWDAETGWRI